MRRLFLYLRITLYVLSVSLCDVAIVRAAPPTTAPTASAALAVKNYEGYIVEHPGDPAIYLVLDGKRRHIPNTDVYHRLFNDGPFTKRRISADYDVIPTGAPLSNDAALVRPVAPGIRLWGDPPSAIFLQNDGILRHIANMTVFGQYNFDVNGIMDYVGGYKSGPELDGKSKFSAPPATATVDVSACTVNPTTIAIGGSATLTVTLNGPAPSDNFTVAINIDADGSLGTLFEEPVSATFKKGATSFPITLKTQNVSGYAKKIIFTAFSSASGAHKSAQLNIQ